MKRSTINKIIFLTVGFVFTFHTVLYAEVRLSNKDKVYQMYKDYQKKFPSVKDINAVDAIKEYSNGNTIFVDVRTEDEIAVSTLPKAVTKKDFLRDKKIHEDKKIIAYCTIGYRSGVFADEMEKEGIEVLNLSAGILGWTHAGGKVYDSRGIVQRIHVYGKDWDYAPEGFDTMRFGLLEKMMKK